MELLLPLAEHLVRILDGRVDAQGSPSDLRADGELDGLVAIEEVEVSNDEPIVNGDAVENEVLAIDDDGEKKSGKPKGPGKKLIQGELI